MTIWRKSDPTLPVYTVSYQMRSARSCETQHEGEPLGARRKSRDSFKFSSHLVNFHSSL
ncbi:hypothetical protein RSWS8N_00030 [Cereibacter sphaeroides WS8N]|nr:hypothetical protein RSWS8N_00030 [Cereibacter sphaeroides WS8N]